MWIVASLWIHKGREAEFIAYEEEALTLFQEHGGEVVARFRPEDGPFEVHILKIANREQFERFRSDERLAKLSEARSLAIKRTDILVQRAGLTNLGDA